MDQIVAETIKGIVDTITKPSLMNIDFADVRAIMEHGGVAVMLVGEAKSQNKASEVVRDCLSHPLLEVDYRGATGALIHITGGPDLTIKEAEEIVNNLTFEISDNAMVIWGARISKEFEGIVRVTAIMTGVRPERIFSVEEEYARHTYGGNGKKASSEVTAYSSNGREPVPSMVARNYNGIDVL